MLIYVYKIMLIWYNIYSYKSIYAIYNKKGGYNMSLTKLWYLVEMYHDIHLRTADQHALGNAIVFYYHYKKNKGKKVIDFLESELVKYELEY